MQITEDHLTILEEIYHSTASGDFLDLEELQLNTGKSLSDLRPLIEDLKEQIFVFESSEGLQIAPEGMHFARSRWV